MTQCGTGQDHGWCQQEKGLFFPLCQDLYCVLYALIPLFQNYPKCECYFRPQVREAEAGVPSSPWLDVRGTAMLTPRF